MQMQRVVYEQTSILDYLEKINQKTVGCKSISPLRSEGCFKCESQTFITVLGFCRSSKVCSGCFTEYDVKVSRSGKKIGVKS